MPNLMNGLRLFMKHFLPSSVFLLYASIPAITAYGKSNYEPYDFTTIAGLPGAVGSADGFGSDATEDWIVQVGLNKPLLE